VVVVGATDGAERMEPLGRMEMSAQFQNPSGKSSMELPVW
jgi:hypothetical protein